MALISLRASTIRLLVLSYSAGSCSSLPTEPVGVIQCGAQFGDVVHGLLQLFGELLVAGHHAQRAFASVDVVGQILNVGDGLVGVVIERGIFQELAGCALAGLQIVHDGIQFVDGVIGAVIEFVVYQQLAETALPVGHLRDQTLELSNGRVQLVVKGGIVDELANRSLAAFDKGDNAVGALEQ